MFRLNAVAVNRPAGHAVMNTGKQDMAIHQPDKIFTAGDARDIHFVGQLVGRKFLLLMRINPLA